MTPAYTLICAYFVALLVVLASIPAAIVYAARRMLGEPYIAAKWAADRTADHLAAMRGVIR